MIPPPSIPELLVESVSRLATVLDRESPPRLESTDWEITIKQTNTNILNIIRSTIFFQILYQTFKWLIYYHWINTYKNQVSYLCRSTMTDLLKTNSIANLKKKTTNIIPTALPITHVWNQHFLKLNHYLYSLIGELIFTSYRDLRFHIICENLYFTFILFPQNPRKTLCRM